MSKIVHSHKSSLYKKVNVFLLMLPGVVFVFVLASYFVAFPKNQKGAVAAAKTEYKEGIIQNTEENQTIQNTPQKY
jgi:amino acid permease